MGRVTSGTYIFSGLSPNSIWETYGALHNQHLECLLVSLFSWSPHSFYLKSILPKWFIEKQLLGRKFARNPLKIPVREQQQKFTMHDLLSLTGHFQVPKSSAPFPNSQNNCYPSSPSLLHLQRTQNSYKFIDLAQSISTLSHNLQLINLQTRQYRTFPISNLHTQANPETLQVQQN